jgi:hypothetical protein
MRVMILDTIYDRFLADHDARDPALAEADYPTQIDALAATFFPCGLTWRAPFQAMGHEVFFAAANNAPSQIRWCRDRDRMDLVEDSVEYRRLGFYRWRRPQPGPWYLKIAAEQVRSFRPDLLIIPFLYTFDSAFLASVAGHYGKAIGQHAAPLPRADLSRYDLILSSLPNQVAHFRGLGIRAEWQPLAFDPRALDALGPIEPVHDVGFLGQVTPDHGRRADFLRSLARDLPIDFWGDADWAGDPPDSAHWRPHRPLWGLDLLRGLRACRIALNTHIDAAGDHANNLRLYEATGVGSLLLTDAKADLARLFEPGVEVETYRDAVEAAAKIRALLAEEPRRRAIAEAGQRRTLRDHTHARRAKELVEMVAGL